jgi:molybdopterin/thiamine biosynthesis adenylyltransferase
MTEILRIEESRYERLEQISWWQQATLHGAKVLVAGAGALGNEILKHLALLGIGRVVVVDFDRIELSNLSRAIFFRASDAGSAKADVIAARMTEVNPDIRVLPVVGDLGIDVGLGLLRRMDVVVAGLDSVGSRRELNRMCWLAGVPWIDGAVGELDGTLRVFVPPEGACFECGLTDSDYRQLNTRHSCQPVPRERESGSSVPTSPTSASVIAAWQVQEALKYLHGRPMLASQGVSCFGNSYEFWKPRYARRAGCPGHESLGEVEELRDASSAMTVSELLSLVADRWGQDAHVQLDREVVLGVRCMSCGNYQPRVGPFIRLRYEEILCSRCGAEGDPVLTHRLDKRPAIASLGNLPLTALGIPPLHVLTVRLPDRGTRSIELTGDAVKGPLAGFLRQEDDDGSA